MKLSIKKLLTTKFIRDFIINAIASALPVVLLQFLIEPLMSRDMTNHMPPDVAAEKFGLMITVVSLFTMLATIFGNTLNNVLLVKHKEIDNERKDYNVLFVIAQALNLISLILILIFVYNVTNPITLILVGVIGICSTFVFYVSAQFRMDFKYHLYLFCELGKCAGYGLGYYLFRVTGDWIYVFLLGAIFETIVCIIFTNVWRYSYKVSKHFKEISFATLFILGSALAASLVNYFDKLILYPIMGGDSVSIYNAAIIISKGLSLITTPLGAVLLGYLVKRKFLTNKQLLILLAAFGVLLVPLFFAFYFASKLILPYMYPAFYEEAQKLLVFTTLLAIMTIYISLCEPILLTHNGEKISLYYGIGKAALSVVAGLVGIKVNGLMGFCIFRFGSTVVIFAVLYVLLLLKSRRIYKTENISTSEEKPTEAADESVSEVSSAN